MVTGLFLLGVSAKVGKTTLAVGLATALVGRGLRVAAIKPIEVGCPPLPAASPDPEGGLFDEGSLRSLARLRELAGPPPPCTFGGTPAEGLLPRDSVLLAAAAGAPAPLDLCLPYRYGAELDPSVAARVAERPIELEQIAAAIDSLKRSADLVLVEGTGGLCTPLGPQSLELDLCARLALPALLIAPSRLGCVHLTLLSLELLRARSLPCAGVVLVRLDRELRPEEASYPFEIERFAGPIVRGVLPYFDEHERSDLDYLARRVVVHLDLEAILAEPDPGPPGFLGGRGPASTAPPIPL